MSAAHDSDHATQVTVRTLLLGSLLAGGLLVLLPPVLLAAEVEIREAMSCRREPLAELHTLRESDSELRAELRRARDPQTRRTLKLKLRSLTERTQVLRKRVDDCSRESGELSSP